MKIVEPLRTEPSYSCWDSTTAKAAYCIVTAAVAAGVIFGALVIISRYGNVPMGENMEYVIDGLGNYTFLPFAASSPFLVVLVTLGIIWQGSDKSGFVDDKSDFVDDSNIPVLSRDLALIEAASRGDAAAVQAHLDSGKFNGTFGLFGVDCAGYSAIHHAVMCQDLDKSLDTMRCLITHNREVVNHHRIHPHFKTTPLHLAVTQNGAFEKVTLLVENGAYLNAYDHQNDQPLFAALRLRPDGTYPDLEIVEYLLCTQYPDKKRFPGEQRFPDEVKQQIELAFLQFALSRDDKAWVNDDKTQEFLKRYGFEVKAKL